MTISGDGEPSSISGLRPLATVADDAPLVESGDERLASTQALRHSVLKCYVSVLAAYSLDLALDRWPPPSSKGN